MWQFNFAPHIGQQEGNAQIRLLNLVSNYTVSTPLNFSVMVNNTSFDCGDLYLTIYNPNTSPKQVIVHHAYFSQCFAQTSSVMPSQDTFSPVIDTPGIYQIVAEMKDRSEEHTSELQSHVN